jgi:hypothetical protein
MNVILLRIKELKEGGEYYDATTKNAYAGRIKSF